MPIALAPIAVCSWSLRASNSAMLVERVQATGARAVQLALTPIADWDGAWGDTFARLADAGIEVVSGMLETVGEDYSTLDTIRATGGVVPEGADTVVMQERAQASGQSVTFCMHQSINGRFRISNQT